MPFNESYMNLSQFKEKRLSIWLNCKLIYISLLSSLVKKNKGGRIFWVLTFATLCKMFYRYYPSFPVREAFIFPSYREGKLRWEKSITWLQSQRQLVAQLGFEPRTSWLGSPQSLQYITQPPPLADEQKDWSNTITSKCSRFVLKLCTLWPGLSSFPGDQNQGCSASTQVPQHLRTGSAPSHHQPWGLQSAGQWNGCSLYFNCQ